MLFRCLLLILGALLCYADIPKIIRPCDLSDYKCIADNLAVNSRCKPVNKGSIPSEYDMKTFNFDTPYFNASYIDNNLIIRNLNKCFVSEFFFNTQSDRAVLSIDCHNLDLESDRTFIQHRSYQEDSYYYFHIRGVYPRVVLTINFSAVSHMDLCTASILSAVAVMPKLHIDPKNKPTSKYLTRDLRDLHIYEREQFHARGRAIAYLVIDKLICDYGCAVPT